MTEKYRKNRPFPTSNCKSCGAEVVWAVNAKTKKRMIFDADWHKDGRWALRFGKKSSTIYAKHVNFDNEADAIEYGGNPLFKSHFATCPNASQHRNPKTGNGTERPNSRGDV